MNRDILPARLLLELAEEPWPPRCRVRRDNGTAPCLDRLAWQIILECAHCGWRASGTVCDFHKLQAEDHGIPHTGSEGGPCAEWAALVIILAAPL